MGHPSGTVLNHILGCISKSDQSCEICHLSKQNRLSFSSSKFVSAETFDLVQCDVWGPYKQCTHGKCSFLLTIVDNFSRCTWIFLFADKTQVFTLIKQFLVYVQNQFNKSVKIFRSDNGTEFLNKELTSHFLNLGIIHQTTGFHTPQQNEILERKHQHLLNVARSLRFHANLPVSFWGDCLLTATHLINMLPSAVLQFKSPYEILLNKPPNYTALRVLGCLFYISNLYSPHDKFSAKTLKCVFLGYPSNEKGYRVMNINTRKCYTSRDIKFVEDCFPFHTEIEYVNAPSHHTYIFHDTSLSDVSESIFHINDTPFDNSQNASSSNSDQPFIPLAQSRPVRNRSVPTKFKDYTGLPVSTVNTLHTKCTYHIEHYVAYIVFKPHYINYLCAYATIPTPYTYSQAVKVSH